ncbi:hypothetical protein NPIL_417491 [Nephila pilipes]|uniref:Uncharacterized protein n=1 Tax=Nephila pilipes TaxID=299642 RepID=A0A8X6T5K5_NEPPI|nr:hypothetical protein NPIL_417491 [Nephila pilipes]
MEVYYRLAGSICPLTFILIGWNYNGLCPANEFLPPLMVLTGVLAITAILFRIIKVHWFLPEDDLFCLLFGSIPLSIDFVFICSFFILYTWINRLKPSNNHTSLYYCDDTFYNITLELIYITQWFVLAYALLRLLQGQSLGGQTQDRSVFKMQMKKFDVEVATCFSEPVLKEKANDASTSNVDFSAASSNSEKLKKETDYQSCSTKEKVDHPHVGEASSLSEMSSNEETEQSPGSTTRELPSPDIDVVADSISGILLLVWLIMLTYLGAVNIGQCPANQFLPVSMVIAGFLAVVAVFV